MKFSFFKSIEETSIFLKQNPTAQFIWMHADQSYSEQHIENIDKVLHEHKNTIGGHFPYLIYKTKLYDQGNLLIHLPKGSEFEILTDTSNFELTPPSYLSKTNSILVFVDGYANNLTDSINQIYNQLGTVKCLGGGAGDLSLKQMPVVFTPNGVKENEAIVVYLKSFINNLSAAHGWSPCSEPLRITKSNGKRIQEINNRPAFDVYKEIIEAISPNQDWDDFFNVAKNFPFGVAKYNDDFLIRDILSSDQKEIHGITEIPCNSYIQIMTGTKETLLNSISAPPGKNSNILAFDCISRILFLNKEYKKELFAISKDEHDVYGPASFGEIFNSGDQPLEMMNKTCIIGSIDEFE